MLISRLAGIRSQFLDFKFELYFRNDYNLYFKNYVNVVV